MSNTDETPEISRPGTSTQPKWGGKDEDEKDPVPFIQFSCSQCDLSEKTLFGDLHCIDGFYPSPVFYMRDPFAPMIRVKGRKPRITDFLVVGTHCSMCQQAMCMSKACGVYFGAHFCATCVVRERRRFPADVLEQLSKAQPKPAEPAPPK